MIRFVVALRRMHEPKNEMPSKIFFPYDVTDDVGQIREIGEALILEITLSEDAVEKLKHGYMQPEGAAAVKSYIDNQLGAGSSVQIWQKMYGQFITADVVQR